MTEYMHLVGAEDVRSAAGTISRAAGELSSAAGSLDSTRDLFMRQLGDANQVFFAQLDERLDRFEALVKRIEEAIG